MLYHFDNSDDNYQHIIDISKTNIAIVWGLLTYVVKVPILEKEEGRLRHLIPIPEKRKETYIGYVPDHEYLILYKDAYIPMNNELLNKCKKIAEYPICL